ncbi:hypothetical protein SLEP1_g35212 [Rubroshorea leprosula]|uniref:protein-serine/threonine phosphatase n=1 Tax=Rubroshorea leprosula TaxID=152421 RepID=A0AAV5KMT6_9ROSI|nr:hypothetical protein SLEP1_g35212 [Rubroshorea leprosula]
MSKSSGKTTPSCQNPVGRITGMSKDDDGDDPDLRAIIWSRDLERHPYGEFSFAEIQANLVKRDYSQIEIASDAIFVGVYDGHGDSDEASHFVAENLCKHFTGLVLKARTISEDSLKRAVIATEEGFLASVENKFDGDKSSAEVGSSCLAGVIWRGSLYVANVGNSRAVIGYLDDSKKMVAEQLTEDHNVNVDEIRNEIMSSNPDDPYIVVQNHGVWHIKGTLQVSRAIGSAYMKKQEYYEHPYFYTRYNLPKPFPENLVKVEPELQRRVLKAGDRFLIFASDGLWENLTIEQAVDIVNNNQRAGIARRLIIRALEEVAKKRNMRLDELKKIQKGTRRSFYDDITVVVIFIDHWSQNKEVPLWESSIRRFRDFGEPSGFNICEEIDARTSLRNDDHPLTIQDEGEIVPVTSPPSEAIVSDHLLTIQDEGYIVPITSPSSEATVCTSKDDDNDYDDLCDLSVPGPLFWSKDLDKHKYGDLSFAVMQANDFMEDHSLVDTGFEATFVGVYDGHGGSNASLYITDNLVQNLTRLALENGSISEDIVKNAVIETENGFLDHVRQNYPRNPEIAAVGSCCLVGVIREKTLYVANVGNSHAVIGFLDGTGKMVAEQLTTDHNVSFQEIREVNSSNPDRLEEVMLESDCLHAIRLASSDVECFLFVGAIVKDLRARH